MSIEMLNEYEREVEVVYKDENFLVRDNGAVCRMQKSEKRKRPLDGKWTFGNKDSTKGYMNVSSHVVHRIVAFAYLGFPPSEAHVVDHIDTNKCNNRPENLRWVTRLENILLNPITLKRVIIGWGSLENFFNDPSRAPRMEPNIDWMRTVSKKEAAECREQLLKWAGSDKLPRGGELGEWIYGVQNPDPPRMEQPQDESLTPLAIQRNWKTPAEFPHCPEEVSSDALATYCRVLEVNTVFSKSAYSDSLVVMAEMGDSLVSVLTKFSDEGAIKPWAVSKVIIEDGKFVHESMQSFFDEDGARKEYSRLLGIELDIETFDDYC